MRTSACDMTSRTYAVVGVEGIAPYWFHVTGQLFLSDKGDLRARLEGSYDERITQRLIFQPRAEFNFSAQDIPAIGMVWVFQASTWVRGCDTRCARSLRRTLGSSGPRRPAILQAWRELQARILTRRILWLA